jgi:hypothetical protein
LPTTRQFAFDPHGDGLHGFLGTSGVTGAIILSQL